MKPAFVPDVRKRGRYHRDQVLPQLPLPLPLLPRPVYCGCGCGCSSRKGGEGGQS